MIKTVSKRITTSEAATRLKICRPELEAWIRSGKCPFGVYVKQEGNSRGAYLIFEERFSKYVHGDDIGKGA